MIHLFTAKDKSQHQIVVYDLKLLKLDIQVALLKSISMLQVMFALSYNQRILDL